MRKSFKRTIAIVAATLTVGALALTGCSTDFKTPTGGPAATDAVSSNGGFAVQKGNYVYFINGVETNESDNTYGDVVKGALMRIKTEDLDKKENKAEIVIPSLMVAEDYTSGIYIYGDRVYYATPNNVKNTSGEIERDYLDFKSAKLDGTDIKNYFNVSKPSTTYRFVETEGKVYVLYSENSTLHSYNTETGDDTVLAQGVKEYVLNSSDKGDPWVYYVMGVTDDIDTDAPQSLSYTQIYRARADWTEAYHDYTYDPDYLEEHNNEAPYWNLGQIVLDGIGNSYSSIPTQFTHDLKDGVTPLTPKGYTYDLQAYENGGLYFLRDDLTKTSSPGEAGWLYYLPISALEGNWNSISGNRETTGDKTGSIDVVALPENTSKASTKALFYVTGEGSARQHHYLYLSSAGNIHRADVRKDGSGEIENDMYGTEKAGNQVGTIVAYNVSGATLISRDTQSDTTYDYVYFTRSNGSGNSVERAVYNGSDRDYENLPYGDDDHAEYKPVKVLNVQHASGWYNYEIIDGRLFYANSESLGVSNYINYVDLRNAQGKLLNNKELQDVNDVYEKITGSDGYLSKLSKDGETTLSAAIKYYFYTGETRLFDENVQEAIDAGKKANALYTEDEKTRFHEFAEGKGDAEEYGAARVLSYFVTKIGKMTEEDVEKVDEYWKGQLERYVPTVVETDNSLEGWEIALIVIACVIVVAGGGLAAYFLVRKNQKEKSAAAPKPARMRVDTTDDRDVDVYAVSEPKAETELAETPAEAPAEEPAEVSAEEPAEAPAEEAAPAPAEAPAEEAAPAPVEAPAEEAAPAPAEAPAEEPKTEE